MADAFTWPHIKARNARDALMRWNDHAGLLGAMARGLFLTNTDTFVRHVRAQAAEMVPDMTVVSHDSRLPHAFLQYPSGAVLRISPVRTLPDALVFAGQGFNWMAVDDPERWRDQGLIETMLMVLDSQNVDTRLVAVGSPFRFINAPVKVPETPDAADLDAIPAKPDPTHIAPPESDDPSA